MFSTGRIVFIIVFLILFVGGLAYAYRKDARVNRVHFPKAYKVLIGLLLFLILQFLIVKLGRLIG